MNKEELKTILRGYSVKRGFAEKYYESLASMFCGTYIVLFTEAKLLSLKNTYNIIGFSRLSMLGFTEEDVKDLSFQDENIFSLDGKPYFKMNLKKQIKTIWTNNEEQTINNLVYVESFLETIDEKSRLAISEELQKYQERMEFLSCFYKYVLILMEERARSKIDLARIGLFTNSYFDVINYNKINLDSGRKV